MTVRVMVEVMIGDGVYDHDCEGDSGESCNGDGDGGGGGRGSLMLYLDVVPVLLAAAVPLGLVPDRDDEGHFVVFLGVLHFDPLLRPLDVFRHSSVNIHTRLNGISNEYFSVAVLLKTHIVTAIIEGVYEEWGSRLAEVHEVERSVVCGGVPGSVDAVDCRSQDLIPVILVGIAGLVHGSFHYSVGCFNLPVYLGVVG